jgi:hypothetical protein
VGVATIPNALDAAQGSGSTSTRTAGSRCCASAKARVSALPSWEIAATATPGTAARRGSTCAAATLASQSPL